MNNREIAHKIIDQIMGTPEDFMAAVDSMIDDGEFTSDQFYDNEIEILAIVDGSLFNCETCGWNVPRGEESDTGGVCDDCYEGDDEDA